MIMNGKEVSEIIKKNIQIAVKQCLVKPCLAVIQVGHNPASDVYIKGKEKACLETGIRFQYCNYEESVSEEEIINKIVELNHDEYVNGILVQLPLPKHLNENKIVNKIISSKDVDGLGDANTGRLHHQKDSMAPCTPMGIIKLLEYYHIDITGKHVVIVGKSNLIGRPLAELMLQKNATVTVCHTKTVSLEKHTKEADILVVATGVKHLINADMVKEGAIVVDVGITRLEGKLYGDVLFEEVEKKASYITPVPGGVGPMTVAMLLTNVLNSYEKSQNK